MIAQELINQILLIPYFFIAVNVLVGCLTFSWHSNIQRMLFVLIIVTGISESISKILWYQKLNNLPVFHFFAVIEFAVFLLIYEKAYGAKVSNANPFRLGIYAMVVFALLNAIFFQQLTEFNSNVITVSAATMTILSLLYFYKLLKEVSHVSLESQPIFWINVGVLIYFSSSLVFFLASNSLAGKSLDIRGIVWGTHAIFNVFHYIAFSIALWVKPKT